MGEIDDTHDAENKSQTARQQEQQQAVLDAVQELDEIKHRDHGRLVNSFRQP
jgi:Mg2+/Co2+ transporter CorC